MVCAVALVPAPADAEIGDKGDDPDPDPTVDDGGVIEATVSGSDFVITEGGSGSGPVCVWKHLTTGQYENKLSTDVTIVLEPVPDVPDLPTDREPTPEEVEAHDAAVEQRAAAEQRNDTLLAAEQTRRATPSLVTTSRNGVNGQFRVFTATCPDRAFGLLFIPPAVDATETIERAVDHIREQIPDPAPAINPPVEVGGVVNLGLWLAVEETPTLGPITAEAGPDSWVTVTAAHNHTVFIMGNGDTVECNGIGDPIPQAQLNDPAPSPTCGYTYRESSFDDAPYQLGIDATWTIPWQSSNGPGSVNHTQSNVLTYDVDEIQTLGTN